MRRHLRYVGYAIYFVIGVIVLIALYYTLTHAPNVKIDLQQSIDNDKLFEVNILNTASIEKNIIVRLNTKYGAIKTCNIIQESYHECTVSNTPGQAVMECPLLPDYIHGTQAVSIAGFECEFNEIPDSMMLKYDSNNVHIEKNYNCNDPKCNNETIILDYVDFLSLLQDAILSSK